MLPSSIQHDTSLKDFNGYKLPAVARYYYHFIDGTNIEELNEVVLWAKESDLPILFISGGTNGILAFDVYEGLVIHVQTDGYSLNKNILTVAGGAMIWDVAQELENTHNVPTWHRFIGLPGSVAGAIYGSAGCFGLEIENTFISCRLFDSETCEVVTWSREEMGFTYRHSRLKDTPGRHIILDAQFDMASTEEKYPQTVDNIAYRNERQPKGNSCGSFFKNPSREQPAGLLLEQTGFKGKKHGGAYFSELHANFLMAEEGCVWQDLVELQQMARDAVKEECGIELENEVQIIEQE